MKSIITEEETPFPQAEQEEVVTIGLRELTNIHNQCRMVKSQLEITRQMCENLESLLMDIIEPIMMEPTQQEIEEMEQARRESDPYYDDAEPVYEDGSPPSFLKDDVPFNENDNEYTDDEPIFAEDNKEEEDRQQELS